MLRVSHAPNITSPQTLIFSLAHIYAAHSLRRCSHRLMYIQLAYCFAHVQTVIKCTVQSSIVHGVRSTWRQGIGQRNSTHQPTNIAPKSTSDGKCGERTNEQYGICAVYLKWTHSRLSSRLTVRAKRCALHLFCRHITAGRATYGGLLGRNGSTRETAAIVYEIGWCVCVCLCVINVTDWTADWVGETFLDWAKFAACRARHNLHFDRLR